MIGLSLRRLGALMRKEWIQVTRDALTLRFIILVPVMQLFLFGFAINVTPGSVTLPAGKSTSAIVAVLDPRDRSAEWRVSHAGCGTASSDRPCALPAFTAS